jgi:hypothetical protein
VSERGLILTVYHGYGFNWTELRESPLGLDRERECVCMGEWYCRCFVAMYSPYDVYETSLLA